MERIIHRIKITDMQMNYWAAPGQFTLNYIEQGKAIESTKYFNPERIENTIVAYFGIPIDDIKLKCRHENIVYARFFMHYFLHVHGTMAKKAIGRYLGQDHTTIIYGIRVIKDQLSLKVGNKYKEDHYKIFLLLNAPITGNV